MPVVKHSSIQELKNRIDIVDVVSPVVSLKRVGSTLKGLSPFNQEKTPSFFVSPDKNLFKCFSSDKAGDIFTFVMETERLSFYEAVEILAKRFGIELEYEGGDDRRERSLRQALFDIHEWAAEFFHEAFQSNTDDAAFVRTYWEKERHFSLDLAKEFKIGLAPREPAALREHILERKAPLEALKECGLFYQRGSTLRPEALLSRFRGRLMIPIRDYQGRIVAFTARQLAITSRDDPTYEAKYINSPETPIFSKSHLLFGLDRARMEAGEEVPFVLVEGQLDALRCWSSGVKSAVAPQGTAISEQQLRQLRRYSPLLECLLDADSAGQKAAVRLLPLAFKVGLETRFLTLPSGKDPDSFLLENGSAALDELRKQGEDALSFATRTFLPNPESTSPEKKNQAIQHLFELIRHIDSEVVRSEYLHRVARLCRLDDRAVSRDFESFLHRATRREQTAPSREPHPSPGKPADTSRMLSRAEDVLISICLHHENLGKPLAEVLNCEWIDVSTLHGRLLNRILAEFEHDLWPGSEEIDALLESEEEKNLAYSLLFEKLQTDDPVKLADQGIRSIYINYLNRKIKEIDLEIANKGERVDTGILFLQRQRIEYRRKKSNPPTIGATHHFHHAS